MQNSIFLIIEWIEKHPVSIELIKWSLLILGAWLLGIFRIIRKYSCKPTLSLFESPGFCFIEDYEKDGKPARLAIFIVNPCIRNQSKESYEIEYFSLGYECRDSKMSFRQKLLPITFPSPPQYQMGEKTKYLPVYFTNFSHCAGVSSIIEPNRKKSGYILFVSKTWGDWNAKDYSGNNINVLIQASLLGTGILKYKGKIRATFSKNEIEELCPGLYDYIIQSNPINISLD